MRFQALPTIADVQAARDRIAPYVRRTPAVWSRSLSGEAGTNVYLKLESVQPGGSFKVRGAFNAILTLDDAARSRGVVCASTGNHGKAIAYAARELGCPATVCLFDGVPGHRIAAIRALGADVHVVGSTQDDAVAAARDLEATRGLTLIHPFDDPAVIAGQGTIGLELVEAIRDLEVVLVPVSGGGLASGVALAVKSLVPHVRVLGVSAAATPSMALSVAAGRPVDAHEQPTLADNLAGGIGTDNRYSLQLAGRHVDAWPTVSEEAIARAMHHLEDIEGVTGEGAGAATVAALLEGKVTHRGGTIVAVISGGNVDPAYRGRRTATSA